MDKGLFEKRCKYSIRKFSLGVASVMIGAAFFGTSTVLADSAQTGSTANMPADLAAALANAKEDGGHDFEAPKAGEDQGSPEVTEGPKTEEELLAKEKETATSSAVSDTLPEELRATSTTRNNESMNLIVYKAYFEGLLYRCFHS